MKKIALGFVALLLVAGGLVGGTLLWAGSRVKATLATTQEYARNLGPLSGTGNVELGRRIVHVRNGCVDCHGADLGGRTFVEDGAMGTFSGTNLTPYALANVPDSDIVRALRFGVKADLKPLVFMPSHEFQNLSLHDMLSVVAYLRTLPPVERTVQPPEWGPMAKILFALGKVPTFIPAASGLIRQEAGFNEKPEEKPDAAFGKYLVQSACIGCHGPELKGGPIPGAPPDWIPATAIGAGSVVAEWTQAELTAALRDGRRPDGSEVKFPMPISLTSKMTDDELKAIGSYLRSLR